MEQIRSPLNARKFRGDRQSVIIHARDGWLSSIQAGKFDFFATLVPHLTQNNMATRIVEAGSQASEILMVSDNVHIMVGGVRGSAVNMLHATPSYIWGFWYLDAVGVHHRSTMRSMRFDPAVVDGEKAAYFFNGVSGHMLRENVSTSRQAPRAEGGLEPAAAVVFCQNIEDMPEAAHFLTNTQMIQTAAQTCKDDRVYVKLHPLQSSVEQKSLRAVCASFDNVVVSAASVHDLSAAARVVITQNSTAGFEALMQKKTVITCGQSDFWHATLTPKSTDDLRAAIVHGPAAMDGFEFEKFFYWFLNQNCLEPQKDTFAARAFARIRDKAYL